MDTNECYIYFALDGDDFDMGKITEAIGIQPTDTIVNLKRGDEFPNYSSWQYRSRKVVSEVIDVASLAKELILPLEDKIDQINEVRIKYNLKARLEVVIWFTADDSQSTPALGFDGDTINFLSKIGAYIDVDTYIH